LELIESQCFRLRIESKEKCPKCPKVTRENYTNCTRLPGKMIRNDKFFEFVKTCKLLAELANKRKKMIIPYPKPGAAQARGKQ